MLPLGLQICDAGQGAAFFDQVAHLRAVAVSMLGINFAVAEGGLDEHHVEMSFGRAGEARGKRHLADPRSGLLALLHDGFDMLLGFFVGALEEEFANHADTWRLRGL